MPALPLDEAGKYVAAAYIVFVTLLVLYVAIIGAKIARIDDELSELNELAEKKLGDPLAAGDDVVSEDAAPRDGEPVA